MALRIPTVDDNGLFPSDIEDRLEGMVSKPGPPGAGVPEGGTPLQVIRKTSAGNTTEWVTPTKGMVGLSRVDNTTDAEKPVSVAQKEAIGAVTPTNGARPVGQGELFINVKDYGAVGNGRADDTGAIQAAVAEAFRVGAVLFWPNGGYLTTGNITRLHEVRHRGNGYINRDGVPFSPEPSFSRKNILHVAPNGAATNDGLSPANPLDVQTALNRLSNYGPVLDGHWVIQHAAGFYPGGYTMPYMDGARRAVEVVGVDMGGPRVPPTVIYERGTSNVAWGLASAKMPIRIADIAFRNFNLYDHTKDGANSGAIRLDAYSDGILWNIHVDTADFGVYALTNTKYTIQGSHIKNCQMGITELWHVTRATSGDHANRNIIENCFYGLKAKELCTGHGDWNEYVNCDYAVHLSRSSTINSSFATFKRNKTVFVMSGGSSFVDVNITLGAGADRNNVFCRYTSGVANVRLGGAENYLTAPYVGMTEKTLGYGKSAAHTGTTADTKLVDLGAFRAGDFQGEGAWIRWQSWGTANMASSTTQMRIRVGGTTGMAVVMPSGGYNWQFEGRMYVTADGDMQQINGTLLCSGKTPVIDGASRTVPFSTTAFGFGVYAQLGDPADTITVGQSVMFTSDL